MPNVTFAKGNRYRVEWAEEGRELYDNAERAILQLHFARGAVSLDELDELVSDVGNLEKIEISQEGNEERSIMRYFCIPIALAVQAVECGIDNEGEPVFERRVVLKLGRMTSVERKLRELKIM